MNLHAASLVGMLLGASPAVACTTSLTVAIETFGEGVTIELRRGVPGSSTVVQTRTSSGGTVYFAGLCAGTYFMRSAMASR